MAKATNTGTTKAGGAAASNVVDPGLQKYRGAARLWAQGEIRTFEKTPAGNYIGVAQPVEPMEEGSENLKWKFKVEVANPDYGKKPNAKATKNLYPTIFYIFKKADGSDNPHAASNLKTDMARCNVEAPANDLPAAELQAKIDTFFKMMEGKKLNLKITHSADKNGKLDEQGQPLIYENVNIKGLAS